MALHSPSVLLVEVMDVRMDEAMFGGEARTLRKRKGERKESLDDSLIQRYIQIDEYD
jgi:hypothetical protein